ncbi:MAG TPA: hypothetical protein DDW42_01305 [Desulfobacteraceae bacterium]|nr:hypothetical protein [Desulfobacteraceae bacterium]
MKKIGRNDPCPCGSGKKFKNCHLGREDELSSIQSEKLKKDVAKKITSLPEINYGRSKEIAGSLEIKEITGNDNILRIKFIDFRAYVALESFDKKNLEDKHYKSAGLIVNPMKTEEKDPKTIYIAITPNIHDSTLIHELAHALDFLGGSGLLPGMTFQLCLEAHISQDHLDHPREFGDWLDYLKNRFHVELDAEDTIISYLHSHNMLIEASLIKSGDIPKIATHSANMIKFLTSYRDKIDELIKNRVGYVGNPSK